MTQRVTNLEFSWLDCKPNSDGTVRVEIGGITAGGTSHKVVLKMSPSSIGYIGAALHDGVANLQTTLDSVKAQLRGQ